MEVFAVAGNHSRWLMSMAVAHSPQLLAMVVVDVAMVPLVMMMMVHPIDVVVDVVVVA